MRKTFKVGWFKESHRHSLAARGIKTNYMSRKRFFAEQQLAPPQPIQINVNASKSKLGSISRTEGTDLRGATPATRIAQLQGEEKLREATEERVRELRPEAQILAQEAEGGTTSSLAIELEKAKKSGASPQFTEALQVRYDASILERARAGYYPTIKELAQVSRSQRPVVLNALRRFQTDVKREKLETSVVARTIEGAKQEVLGSTAESEARVATEDAALLAALEKEDKTQAALAKRLGPGFPNPIIPGFQDRDIHVREDGLKGVFNPFIDMKGHKEDTSTPLLSRYDTLLGKSLIGNAQEVEPVKQEVEQLRQGRRDFAMADKGAYKQGLDAFKKGDREKLVKSIVTLEAEGQKLGDRDAIARATESNVISDLNRRRQLQVPNSTNVFAGPRTGGAQRLADETQQVSEVRRDIRASRNEVLGRAEDLKSALRRLDARAPPVRSVPQGKVQIFNDNSLFGV